MNALGQKWSGGSAPAPLLVAVALLLAASTLASAFGPSPLLERFEQAYRQVLAQAAAGGLPDSAEEAAIELRRDLQHELVDRDSALERLKRQAQGASPAQREDLLDRAAEAGAARERVLGDYLRRMEQLLGAKGHEAASAPPSPPVEPAPAPERSFQLQIESSPEDPTLGRFE